MISVQNPIAFCRKVIHAVKGIDRTDEWKVYVAVSFFSMVVSFLCVLYGVDVAEVKSVRGSQHIVLPLDESALKVDFGVKDENEETPSRRAEVEEVQSSRPASSGGDWYYDEVHKDWRYR